MTLTREPGEPGVPFRFCYPHLFPFSRPACSWSALGVQYVQFKPLVSHPQELV